jgi:hypothetical protein
MRERLILLAILCGVLVAAHLPYLDLPFFWDELGQFVPAGLDILREGAWVPKSTIPNVHPPGVMAYLALVWRIWGYSIPVTRVAMMVVAGLGAWLTFLLAVRLCRTVPGLPAFPALAFLLCSPLFYMQSMMAQLDMPAMTATLGALLLFLNARYGWAAAVCTALVLVKETGALLPALFAAWLFFVERRRREASYFLIPFLPLASWLAVLRFATGHWLGDDGFAHYNVAYQWHPVRLAATLARRAYYLFLANGHVLGTFLIWAAWRRSKIFRTREWALVGTFFALHVLAMSLFGGAALERYLMPVLPLLYIAFGAALALWKVHWQWVCAAALAIALLLALFWNPPHPFPFENNLAMVDFVALQKLAAEFLDNHAAGRTVASAWPMTAALRSSDFGYTSRGRAVIETSDFRPAHVLSVDRQKAEAMVVYMRTWEPPRSVLQWRWVKDFLRRFYDYEPQVDADAIREKLDLHPVLRLTRGGQFIEIYLRTPPDAPRSGPRQVVARPGCGAKPPA